jgi:hypothetical protein
MGNYGGGAYALIVQIAQLPGASGKNKERNSGAHMHHVVIIFLSKFISCRDLSEKYFPCQRRNSQTRLCFIRALGFNKREI